MKQAGIKLGYILAQLPEDKDKAIGNRELRDRIKKYFGENAVPSTSYLRMAYSSHQTSNGYEIMAVMNDAKKNRYYKRKMITNGVKPIEDKSDGVALSTPVPNETKKDKFELLETKYQEIVAMAKELADKYAKLQENWLSAKTRIRELESELGRLMRKLEDYRAPELENILRQAERNLTIATQAERELREGMLR